jgi:1,4-dihydroxy-2-naphthoyl-CoA hydrolase
MSRLWFADASIDAINNRPKNHIGALLGIEFTEIGDDYIKATMPVDQRTHQPVGILHGGASVVLAETLGSIASSLIIDPEKFMAVGLEVNANHLRPVKSGLVTGICTPIHIGGKTHVWDIKMYDERGKMNCVSRLTVAIVPKL